MAYIRTSGTSKQRQRLLSILFLHIFLCTERSECFTCRHFFSFSDNSNRSACTAMQKHSSYFQTSLAQPGYLSQWSTRAWCLPLGAFLPQRSSLMPLWATEGMTKGGKPVWANVKDKATAANRSGSASWEERGGGAKKKKSKCPAALHTAQEGWEKQTLRVLGQEFKNTAKSLTC